MRVRVYYNLHKHVWSIKCMERGPKYNRVVAHREVLELTQAKPVISKAGQERVRKEGKKYVHAYIEGHWDDITFPRDTSYHRITYNPYKDNNFRYVAFKGDYSGSDIALFHPNRVVWVSNR